MIILTISYFLNLHLKCYVNKIFSVYNSIKNIFLKHVNQFINTLIKYHFIFLAQMDQLKTTMIQK